jgi:hypothetical protein
MLTETVIVVEKKDRPKTYEVLSNKVGKSASYEQ